MFAIDTRFKVENQFSAFASYGHEVPPRTAELMDLMLQAARGEHEEPFEREPRPPQVVAVITGLWHAWPSPAWTPLPWV